MKDFKQEFWKFYSLFKEKTPFSFVRFSDGEKFIMDNKEVLLAENCYITGNTSGVNKYTDEEQKHFLPGRDEAQRLKLIETFQYHSKNYYKGIPARSDIEESEFVKMIKDSREPNEDNLTFANLLINSNYPLFMNNFLPIIGNDGRKVCMVMNKNCITNNLPFKLDKEYRIGNNCLANHLDLPKEIAEFFRDKKDWIILCSAASLSNLIGYECFKSNPSNTIIDIGSSLNPILGLTGWIYSRDYLRHYWLKINSSYATREELW